MKIPLLLFEASSMGLRFTGTRLIVDMLGIVVMAHILEGVMTFDEKELIYRKFESA